MNFSMLLSTAIVMQDDDSGIGDIIGATGSTQQHVAFLYHQSSTSTYVRSVTQQDRPRKILMWRGPTRSFIDSKR